MRTKIGAFVTVVGLALALGVSASRAAIVETIIDTDDHAAVGSITFPTFTGDSDTGVLFSFAGFTEAAITSVSWSLDPTDAVVALDLIAIEGDNPCPNGSNCSKSMLNMSPTQALENDVSCSNVGAINRCLAALPRLTHITFVPLSLAVPEPSTWAMMVIGLLGLGLAGRRSRKATAG
jgi:hypothetical protein